MDPFTPNKCLAVSTQYQFQLLITRSIFSCTETSTITFMRHSIYKSPTMWSYIPKNWPAIVIHCRTSSKLFLAIKSKPQSQKLTEYGLLKLDFGNSNLSFIYLSPTFKAIMILSLQPLKLIFETTLKSPFHLANFSSVGGSEVEVHSAFSHLFSFLTHCCMLYCSRAGELLLPHRESVGNKWNFPDTFNKQWLIAFLIIKTVTKLNYI